MDVERDSSLVGRRLGEFVVRELLSSGGFGSVYRAEQPALAREAVIKVMHTRLRASEELVQRFLREAQLASRLDHPYAAHIYAFGAEPDGLLWIAMELVRGTPLDTLLQVRGPVPLEQFVPLLERICQVVQTAHDQGIVHRDLKPANVMVLARAGQLLPKLLDFGIAKRGDEADAPTPGAAPDDGETSGRLTELGAAIGSPLYMAPEQWADAAAVDARTDIYALGVLCHEVLTGKPPFTGKNRLAIARAHAKGERPPLGAAFPPALEAVVARALARKKAERYPSALELSTAFKTASGVADAPIGLPRLDEALRGAALVRAPQPLAQAVAALEAARNAHQARDAAWQVVRVAARLVGITALAAHLHVGSRAQATDTAITDALRRLRRRAVPDADWIALARELIAPFRALREAYPVPELVDYVATGADALAELAALREASDGPANDETVRELLATLVPKLEALLRALDFFGDYRLIVPTADAAEVWMGVRRDERARLPLRGPPLAAGQPALASADGLPVVSLYPFVQRHAPAPGVADQLFWFEGKGRRGARLVAVPESFEVEDEGLWEVVGDLVPDAATGDGATSVDEQSPFPGLAAFTAADAGRFFGRERETEGVVNRLRAQALVAVVGPSGAGKSSFVQAGVVPSLPADWQVVTLRPGADPMASLAARLAAVGLDPAAVLDAVRARGGAPLVIVVDQFEELFTLCDDPAARERFAAALVKAAGAADDPIRVVLTLRDDFLLHAEALPALRARLAPALHLLTTPDRDDLLRMVREPLAQVGYELDDPALAGEMVDALATERSALALLSFTASRLWELRDRRFRQISRKAYASLGGVGGALAKHAEAALAAMTPEEQRLVREALRHAVTAEGTRAVLSRAELDQLLGGGPHAAAVVEKLIAARLLVSAESAGGGEQIELTHEALIEAWPRLVGWRREDAEGARLRDQLRAAARQWDDRKRPSGLLWRGDALAEYRLWRGRHPGALTDVERAFADASVAESARTGRRRTITLAAAFAVLTLGVIALTVLNRSANRSASSLRDERRDQAEEQGRSAWVDLHDAPQALRYLQQAADLGEKSPAHDLLVAFASRVPASQLAKIALPNMPHQASFSPDGSRLVIACDDGTARVWDVAARRELLAVHQAQEVQRAEWSRDGTAILTAGFDGTAVLWDARTGAQRARFPAAASSSNVLCARLSPDGTRVITATDHDAAALWDAATGRRIATLHEAGDGGELQFGTPCAWSADGSRFAIGDVHGATRIWDANAALIATATGQTDQINDVAFSPDGRSFSTASSDGTAAVWDVATGARVRELRHRDRVWSARWSPDGAHLVTASNDRTAVVWDLATGGAELTLTHDVAVNKAIYQPDGEQIATVADDGSAYLWDTTTGRRESTLQGHKASIADVAYDPAGTRLVTAGDGVIMWSAASQQPVMRLRGHTATISSLDFSSDARLLATADRAGAIILWDWAVGARVRSISAAHGTRDARFSPDGRSLASGGGDNDVHVWDVATGREVGTITGHTDEVRRVAWSPDGARIASASFDGTVRVSTVAGGPPLVLHVDPRANFVAFTPSGADLLTVGADGEVRLWDLSDPRAPRATWRYVQRTPGRPDAPIALDKVTFDRDGRTLLGTSNSYNMAVVWDRSGSPDTGRELRGHGGTVFDSAWSPEGTFALTGSIDGTARLWDAKTGMQVTTFDLGLDQVWSVAYSRDGRHVATGTKAGVVLVWELPIAAK